MLKKGDISTTILLLYYADVTRQRIMKNLSTITTSSPVINSIKELIKHTQDFLIPEGEASNEVLLWITVSYISAYINSFLLLSTSDPNTRALLFEQTLKDCDYALNICKDSRSEICARISLFCPRFINQTSSLLSTSAEKQMNGLIKAVSWTTDFLSHYYKRLGERLPDISSDVMSKIIWNVKILHINILSGIVNLASSHSMNDEGSIKNILSVLVDSHEILKLDYNNKLIDFDKFSKLAFTKSKKISVDICKLAIATLTSRSYEYKTNNTEDLVLVNCANRFLSEGEFELERFSRQLISAWGSKPLKLYEEQTFVEDLKLEKPMAGSFDEKIFYSLLKDLDILERYVERYAPLLHPASSFSFAKEIRGMMSHTIFYIGWTEKQVFDSRACHLPFSTGGCADKEIAKALIKSSQTLRKLCHSGLADTWANWAYFFNPQLENTGNPDPLPRCETVSSQVFLMIYKTATDSPEFLPSEIAIRSKKGEGLNKSENLFLKEAETNLISFGTGIKDDEKNKMRDFFSWLLPMNFPEKMTYVIHLAHGDYELLPRSGTKLFSTCEINANVKSSNTKVIHTVFVSDTRGLRCIRLPFESK
jgi:hypothetical protein